MISRDIFSYGHHPFRKWLALVLLLPLLVQVLGCDLTVQNNKKSDDAVATIAAMQATIDAHAAATSAPLPTAAAPTAPPPTVPPPPPTQPQPTQAAPQAPAATSAPPVDIEKAILASSVLLYEDTAGDPDVFRYVAAAMERLGFRKGDYTDVGDARGRFMDALKRGSPNNKPWDLVIIAAEERSGVQGEFFESLEGTLAKGSSVILETWYLDEIKEGAIKPILMRCGVDADNWFGSSRQPSDLKVYPLIPDSPLLNEVVRVGQFKIADFWPYEEQGDLMYLTGTGDAKLVVGTRPNEPNSYGVLAECLNGQLIIQSFSTHNYMDETMVPLWANYIHYILRRRLER